MTYLRVCLLLFELQGAVGFAHGKVYAMVAENFRQGLASDLNFRQYELPNWKARGRVRFLLGWWISIDCRRPTRSCLEWYLEQIND